MAEIDKELIERFKEVVMRLPEDKRREMYERLKSMSEEDRNKAMRTIVSKATAIDKPRATKPVHMESAPVKKPRENESAQTKKSGKIKPNYKNIFISVFAAICVLVIGVEVYRNFDKIRGTSSEPSDVTSAVTDTDVSESSAEETTEAGPTDTPTPTPTPAPTNVPLAADAPDLTGLVIVIDPGHQAETSEETENCATWLSVEKPRCTSGGTGVVSGMSESELTLQYAYIMRDYLEQCGATVILTRETNDVDISNQERAQIAVDNNADLFIRLHADSANDSLQSGVRVYVPDSGSYTSQSVAWGDTLGNAIAEAEGLEFVETRQTYLYTGLNYANSVPSFQVSVGFLSNSDDEAIIITEDNMVAVADATADFCADFKN